MRKKPSLVDEVLKHVKDILDERNHGLLICGLRLVIEILKIKPSAKDEFESNAKKVVRFLKDISS